MVKQHFFYVPYVYFVTLIYTCMIHKTSYLHICVQNIYIKYTQASHALNQSFFTDVLIPTFFKPTFSDRRSQTNVFWSDVLIPTFFKPTFSYRHFSDRRSQTDILRPMFFGATFSYRHFSDRRSQTDIFTFFCTMLSH